MYENIPPPARVANEDWDDGLPFPDPVYEGKDYAGLETLEGDPGAEPDLTLDVAELDVGAGVDQLVTLHVAEPARLGVGVGPEHADEHLVLVLRTVGRVDRQAGRGEAARSRSASA